MMISKVTITYFLLMIALIHVVRASFTAVPPPPKPPDHFHSKEELKRYLQKVHEYHTIVGRWRLRRTYDEHQISNTINDDLFKFFNTNNDHHISYNKFLRRMIFNKGN
ncbi:unnamed protein product [Rotaria sordida]|uniref:Uncharacterized protein n=1 Tax=Rotaria sordida TaxID=392033 RepID=A0A813WX14_9BILA|nr:unnamed protein product [Rotaria sordida]CAF3815940.1 unnamed protein product [Rotaria sordida]